MYHIYRDITPVYMKPGTATSYRYLMNFVRDIIEQVTGFLCGRSLRLILLLGEIG